MSKYKIHTHDEWTASNQHGTSYQYNAVVAEPFFKTPHAHQGRWAREVLWLKFHRRFQHAQGRVWAISASCGDGGDFLMMGDIISPVRAHLRTNLFLTHSTICIIVVNIDYVFSGSPKTGGRTSCWHLFSMIYKRCNSSPLNDQVTPFSSGYGHPSVYRSSMVDGVFGSTLGKKVDVKPRRDWSMTRSRTLESRTKRVHIASPNLHTAVSGSGIYVTK